MTPIKHSVIQALLPVLLQATQSVRSTIQIDPDLARIFAKWAPSLSANYMDFTAEVIQAVTGKVAPTSLTSKMPPILTVVIPNKDVSDHKYIIGKPHIVIHQSNGRLLDASGRKTSISPSEIDIATDEQVEDCLNNLSEYELRFILTDGIFAPHVAIIFAETELVEEKPQPKK